MPKPKVIREMSIYKTEKLGERDIKEFKFTFKRQFYLLLLLLKQLCLFYQWFPDSVYLGSLKQRKKRISADKHMVESYIRLMN